MKVMTKSGSVYEFDGDKVRRVSPDPKRRDGDWISVLSKVGPVVGLPMTLVLEPLGPEDSGYTIRHTSRVVTVEE